MSSFGAEIVNKKEHSNLSGLWTAYNIIYTREMERYNESYIKCSYEEGELLA